MDVSLVIDNRESEGLGPSHEAKIGFGAPFLFCFFMATITIGCHRIIFIETHHPDDSLLAYLSISVAWSNTKQILWILRPAHWEMVID